EHRAHREGRRQRGLQSGRAGLRRRQQRLARRGRRRGPGDRRAARRRPDRRGDRRSDGDRRRPHPRAQRPHRRRARRAGRNGCPDLVQQPGPDALGRRAPRYHPGRGPGRGDAPGGRGDDAGRGEHAWPLAGQHLPLRRGPRHRVHRRHPLLRRAGRDGALVQRRADDPGVHPHPPADAARGHRRPHRARRRHHDRRGVAHPGL
ncbi:MAG: Putative hydrolase in cluster with formaldehyde/S-nitrosomycothiol reductase MscR, partial [uncultured Blastococcus sp.]